MTAKEIVTNSTLWNAVIRIVVAVNVAMWGWMHFQVRDARAEQAFQRERFATQDVEIWKELAQIGWSREQMLQMSTDIREMRTELTRLSTVVDLFKQKGEL
jgi:hypothetical protein